MPDPLETLRNDIAAMLYSWGGRVLSWDGVCKHDWDERDQFLTYADDVIAVLAAASGEQRRALLGLLEYEVREGISCEPWPEFVYPNEREHESSGCPGPTFPVLVLRDQRETTDA
jgi:hypothetical protein